MAVSGPHAARRRSLVYPLLLLGGTALVVFLGLYYVDWRLAHQVRNPIALLLTFDVDTLENALGNMAQVVAAVLGIVITVVSIVVQLAATRYTPRIADMFFRDRTNLGVLAFFAYRMRRQSAHHKRLILIATIGLMDAAVGRWPIAFFQQNPKAQDLVPFAFLLTIMVYDMVTQKKILKSTLYASIFLIVVHMTRVPIGFTHTWHSFATFMLGKG